MKSDSNFLLCHSEPRQRKGRDRQPLQSPEAEGQASEKHNWPVFLAFHLILYLCYGCCVSDLVSISFRLPLTAVKSHATVLPIDIDLDSSVY